MEPSAAGNPPSGSRGAAGGRAAGRRKGAAVPLTGTLDIAGFADVVTLVGRRGLGGRLEVRAGEVLVRLYFEDGRCVGLSTGRRVPTGGARDALVDVCARLLGCERGSFEL